MSEKAERQANRKTTAKILRQGAKWLSNVSTQDAKKIKRPFPQVVEGPPRRTDRESVEELAKDGLIGLYQ